MLSHCQRKTENGESRCRVLEQIQLAWSEPLQVFICKEHCRMLPGDYIWRHITSRDHPGKYPNVTRYDFFLAIMHHMSRCYPLVSTQRLSDVKNALPRTLPAPLIFQEAKPKHSQGARVMKRYKCPVPHCDVWSAENSGHGGPLAEHTKHFRSHPEEERKNYDSVSVPAQSTQRVEAGAGRSKKKKLTGFSHVFIILAADHPSPANPDSDHLEAATTNQMWSAAFGWDDYLAELVKSAEDRPQILQKNRALVALPSRERVRRSLNPAAKALEQGLLLSNLLNFSYLRDAVGWVHNQTSSFRALFQQGK